jgi:excinuclease ABC subunit C
LGPDLHSVSMRCRPRASEIPDGPGVYLFRDAHGEVLYVGKARSLRKRLPAYFGRDLQVRTRAMVDAADTVEWIVTDSEVGALMVEYSLIHEHRPRYNIRLRDDKSFPYLAITRSEEWPRVAVTRGKQRRGTQYFGPYAHAYAIRQTLDLVLRTFPIRTCSDAKYRRHQRLGRPCLLFDIERCSGPCVGAVGLAEYASHVDGLAAFLAGNSDEIVERLRGEMEAAAEGLQFELAARLRDRLASVEKAMARQEVVTQRDESFDLFAFEEDELEAALVVLKVRRGRLTGRLAAVVDKVEDVTSPELLARMLGEVYGDEVPPREVLTQEVPDDAAVIGEWLAARRGSVVVVRVPQRGPKRRLLETARANAREVLSGHRLRRHSDHNARARALRSLQEVLGLADPPLRIEAYDISTIQGRDTVGSMVVMEDGLPRRSEYRRFRIRGVAGQDDLAAMEEVLRRRLTAYLKERDKPVEERGRFAYPPSLLLVDGGAGQVARGAVVLSSLGLDIPVVGLAKRMEEVHLPGVADPVRIARGEEALYLLQQIRDEAHRFAVTYHRALRGRRMVDSVLDSVPGIGPARKKELLNRFGSLSRIREAEVSELMGIVPAAVVEALRAVLGQPASAGGGSREENADA